MAYIDSHGAEMPDMSFSEALELVHELAAGNVIDERDIAFGDSGLAAQRDWQNGAIATLHDLVVNHEDELDALTAPSEAQEWPDTVWQADRDMDPSLPINAIRICLDSAEQAAIDPAACGRDVELADEHDRQQQAFDVVRDLLGMHGVELTKIVVIDTSAGLNSSSSGPGR